MGAQVTERSDETDQADEVLDAAIRRWAVAYAMVEPGDIITEYVVGIAAQNMAHERPGTTRYSWGSRHDAMPLHHVLGLLEVVGQAANESCTDGEGWME